MAWGKHEVFHKVEPVDIQSAPHNLSAVCFAEFGEVICLDDFPLQLSGVYDAAFKPTERDPSLNFIGANMQSFRKRVFGEPVLPHFGACA